MKINYNTLNEKVREYSKLSVSEKYIFADRLFSLLETGDPDRIKQCLMLEPFNQIYRDSQLYVLKETTVNNLKISHHNRELFLIYNDDSKSFASDFFEICHFTEKLSPNLLDQIILLGFFMKEERMMIIQSYESLTGEISSWIRLN